MEAKDELLKDTPADPESALENQPDEIAPEDADKIAAGARQM